MGLILGFAPFIIMAVGTRLVSVDIALAAAFAVALFNLGRTLMAHKTPKLLEIGNLVLFGGALAYGYLSGHAWSKDTLGLVTNGGLALVVWFGIAIGKPFTLQYAAEQVVPEVRTNPRFILGNRIMSAVWGLAFILMLVVNGASVAGYVPADLYGPANIAIMVAAGWFTWWFPNRMKARAATV